MDNQSDTVVTPWTLLASVRDKLVSQVLQSQYHEKQSAAKHHEAIAHLSKTQKSFLQGGKSCKDNYQKSRDTMDIITTNPGKNQPRGERRESIVQRRRPLGRGGHSKDKKSSLPEEETKGDTSETRTRDPFRRLKSRCHCALP